MKLKSILTASALTLATLVSTQASAAIIGSMDFATSSGWLANGVNSSTKGFDNNLHPCSAGADKADNKCALTFFNPEANIADGYKSVNWGLDPFSGLDVVSYNGTLVTNGGWVQTGLITHRNQPISLSSWFLNSLELSTLFSITNPFAFGPVPAQVGVKFVETENKSVGSCGYPQLSAVGCDDTFTIDLTTNALTFAIDSQNYLISFKLLPGSGVTSITNPDGTITLVTAEGSNNNISFMAKLETIPEPATIGVLGLSLVLLTMRRNKKLS